MSEHVIIRVTEIDEDDMVMIDVKGSVTDGESALPVSSFPDESVAVDDKYSGQITEGEIKVDAKF